MPKTENTQLLVAGGGPVGLFAALVAAQRGLDVVVVERSFRGAQRGHTTLLHPSSVRLLQALGMSSLLLRSGQLMEDVQLRIGSNSQRLTLHYPALAITQTLFEETLLKALRHMEVDIRAPCEVVTLRQDDEHVEVGLARRQPVEISSRPEHDQWELVDATLLRADFVIGADGRNSRVRELLGIGVTREKSARYAMFEFPRALAFDAELVVGAQSHAVVPLAHARARCSFQLDANLKAAPDVALLNTLLTERAPWFQERPTEFDWGLIADFESTLADTWGRGRVWLAGDSAHTASPLGVQSMNRGLSEALALVDEICAVTRGGAVAPIARLATAYRESWSSELERGGSLDLLSHAPPWLSGRVRQLATSLPVSGTDLDELLQELGVSRHQRA